MTATRSNFPGYRLQVGTVVDLVGFWLSRASFLCTLHCGIISRLSLFYYFSDVPFIGGSKIHPAGSMDMYYVKYVLCTPIYPTQFL